MLRSSKGNHLRPLSPRVNDRSIIEHKRRLMMLISVPATSRRGKGDEKAVVPAAATLPSRRLYEKHHILEKKIEKISRKKI